MRVMLVQGYTMIDEAPIFPLGLCTLGACLSDRHEVQVFDTNDLAQPREVARLGTPGLSVATALLGTWLYAVEPRGDAGGHLRAIDVTDPRSPNPGPAVDTADQALGVDAELGRVYVAARTSGLLIYRAVDAPATGPAEPRPPGPNAVFVPVAISRAAVGPACRGF